MINALYQRAAVADLLRAGFRKSALAGTIVPSLVEPRAAAALRADVLAAGLTRYDFAPRGRYDHNDTHRPAALLDPLATLVARVTGESITIAAVRWLRLRHGDYALLWDDHLRNPTAGRYFDATVDFSATTTGQGGSIYVVGEETLFVAPQLHGCLSLVERAPPLLRYERYLNHTVGDAEVWRLRVAFLPHTTS